MEPKKRISIVGLIISLLLFVAGISITLAVYTYTRSGTVNSKQLVGDIYMHYTESNSITLENAMPRNSFIANKYFEFTIDGKNTTTNKDIYYDIILSHGDVPTGKTESNRILDEFLRFRLVEVINNEENEIFTYENYSDMEYGSRIYVDTINKNTTNEVTHVYRLYMWIGSDVVIGNNENTGVDYTQSEWNNLFASIKVDVTGDFEEKEVATNDNCFITALNTETSVLNTNMTSEEMEACIYFVNNYNNGLNLDSGSTAETYCQGSGTINGYTIQDRLDNNSLYPEEKVYFEDHNVIKGGTVSIESYNDNCGSDVIIPSKLSSTTYTFNSNLTNEQIQICVQYIIDEDWDWDTGETVEAFCNGTGTIWGYTFQENLDKMDEGFDLSDLEFFEEHRIIKRKQNKVKYNVEIIDENSFYNKGLNSVVIPDIVTYIGADAFSDNPLYCVVIDENTTYEANSFYSYAGSGEQIPSLSNDSQKCNECFWGNLLNDELEIVDYNEECGTEVIIPNQISGYPVTSISRGIHDHELNVFEEINITSVRIPNSVTTIGSNAFYRNILTSVNIPNSVTTIGTEAFAYNKLSNVEIPNSVTTIGDNAFYGNQLTSVTIGNGITSLGSSAFSKLNGVHTYGGITYYNNPNLTSIAINKSCIEIKNNLRVGSNNYYPWLSNSSPYTGLGGVTIYGANNQVCDTF